MTKSAYYSRNDSFSRSYNAEVAEEEGRLPRSRAAKSLGLSTSAFDAGCRAAGYRATEWHHVGKYATQVYYYDAAGLARDPRFWIGALSAMKTRAARRAVLARWDAAWDAARKQWHRERMERLAAFRERLHRQWTETQAPTKDPYAGYRARFRWMAFTRTFYARVGCPYEANQAVPEIQPGDFATLQFRAAVRLVPNHEDNVIYYTRMLQVCEAKGFRQAAEQVRERLASARESAARPLAELIAGYDEWIRFDRLDVPANRRQWLDGYCPASRRQEVAAALEARRAHP